MVMANLANLPMELSDLAAYLVGLEIKTISDVLPKGKSMLDLPEYVVADKCCWDVRATMAVYPKLLEMVDSEYLKMELGLIPILVRMSVRGLKVDQVVRDELENKYRQEVNFYLEIAEAQGFNPGSPQQVGYMLANRGNILEVRRRGFRKSLVTDENALRKLKDPLAAVVLNYRKAKYVLSHYIEPLRGKDRAYTRFHMFASTGRISSTDMNMQNFPPDVRGMIVPDSGVFTKFDYSQQELRTLAYMSQDKDMLEIYERGGDIHQETADFMGVPRRVAKNVTFAMVYGGSPDVIMETAGIEDRDLAVRLQQVWFGKYKGAARWIREIQEFGLRRGWVETILGRRLQLQRRFDRELSDKEVRNRAVNYPIQGSAAEITKLAMLRLKDMPIALQIHDELVIDGDVEVPREIEHVYKFHTPIEVRRASRWE
jgi:DNA polymerase-1